MELDVAHTDEEALHAHLELLLDARVVNLVVKHVDLVNDTTLVEVRYVASATPDAIPEEDPAAIARARS